MSRTLDTVSYQLSKFSSPDIMFIGKDFNCTIRKTDFINENEKDLSCLPQGYELAF